MTQEDVHSWDDPSSEGTSLWTYFGMWRTVAAVSLVLLFVTFNPLLAGVLPYLRAGWPAVHTAFWLKMNDPWKARGTVGWLFHLCMAGFRAGACGAACAFLTVFAAAIFNNEQVDLVPFMTAIGAVVFGCFLSFVFGWVGIGLALRHGIRVYVKSNLYHACRGDFDAAKTLLLPQHKTNPAHFIIATSIAVTLLAVWFVAMLVTMPGPGDKEEGILPFIVLNLLLFLIPVCIWMVMSLSKRMIASSPADCWGAEPPEVEDEDFNWYRTTD